MSLDLATTDLSNRRAAGPRAPKRASGKLRAEHVLDVTDTLLQGEGAATLSLPAVAAAAGIAPSSLYHFFPSLDALLAALLHRYNSRMDEWLDKGLLDAAPFEGWTDMVDALLHAIRRFYDDHPVYLALMARASASPFLSAADARHMTELGERFAVALHAAFHLPPIPDLPRRLTLAAMVVDRLWSATPLENGKISNFTYEESRRMMMSYLANFLPVQPLAVLSATTLAEGVAA